MVNRSEVFSKAWAAYRLARVGIFAKGDETGRRAFLRPLFVKMLRRAWDEAKKAAATVAAFLKAQNRVQAAAVAQMGPMARSARIASIRDELQVLDYAPLGVRTSQRRMDLNAELQHLTS